MNYPVGTSSISMHVDRGCGGGGGGMDEKGRQRRTLEN